MLLFCDENSTTQQEPMVDWSAGYTSLIPFVTLNNRLFQYILLTMATDQIPSLFCAGV